MKSVSSYPSALRAGLLLTALLLLMGGFGLGCNKECIDQAKRRTDPCDCNNKPTFCGCNRKFYPCECEAQRDGVQFGYAC